MKAFASLQRWISSRPSRTAKGGDTLGKYDKALRKIGIDLGQLSTEAGHA
jgi:putative AlgH/UPF0301 family transcriptional regulator